MALPSGGRTRPIGSSGKVMGCLGLYANCVYPEMTRQAHEFCEGFLMLVCYDVWYEVNKAVVGVSFTWCWMGLQAVPTKFIIILKSCCNLYNY